MNAVQRLRAGAFAVTALACLVGSLPAAAPPPGAEQQPRGAEPGSQDPELAIGKEVFNELKAKGEIIESSPLYDALMPVIEPIMRAAQPRYSHPFHVYLVHEAQPNAFATPGGNIY